MLKSEYSIYIKKKPVYTGHNYDIYALDSATGVVYVTESSPHFVSGHLRMLGTKKGGYPINYKAAIEELFGAPQSPVIEACSGGVQAGFDMVTVDINPEMHPTYVEDAQNLRPEWTNFFSRWYCDPPYNEQTAEKMYGVKMPVISKLLTEGARVTKPGGSLFMLLGAANLQWRPKSLIRIGWICITVVPLQEMRTIHCYYKM